jgi:hypothetical protein
VCLEELSSDESICILPGCKHSFHYKCITRWVARRDACPLCNSAVLSHIEGHDSLLNELEAHVCGGDISWKDRGEQALVAGMLGLWFTTMCLIGARGSQSSIA